MSFHGSASYNVLPYLQMDTYKHALSPPSLSPSLSLSPFPSLRISLVVRAFSMISKL
jgi:hypothetical protein